MILFLDLETYSDVPINHGTHRYCESPVLGVLLTAYAEDDEPARCAEGWTPAIDAKVAKADTIVIHNSKFDRTVLEALGHSMPVHKIHDTLAQARSHGLPGGLDALCSVLRVPLAKAKDKDGRQLIHLFCKPQPAGRKIDRATKATHPAEWQRFRDYAAQDVEAMRECYKRMPRWNYGNPKAPAERGLWLLDQEINDRGFLIDLELAECAVDAVKAEQKRLAKRVNHLSYGEVDAATQRDAMLAHVLEYYGVELPDMQKGTLTTRLEDETLPEVVKELLRIRLEASGTATAKYNTLLKATSSDGRLRGALEFCGAARTGRWAGRQFQPQNLPRPKHSRADTLAFIDALKAGVHDLAFDDTIARASSAIRGSLVAPPGRKLVVADLSNIEGRVLAWLAGEEWKLQAFRDFDTLLRDDRGHLIPSGDKKDPWLRAGPDLYNLAYARSFGVPVARVTGDQRQIGKVQELALGYQGAVGAFASMAALYGMTLPEDEVLALVKAWRRANSAIKTFWYDLERASIDAIRNPGVTLPLGRIKLRRDGAWFKIVLPSGRGLVYPNPRILIGGDCDACEGKGKLANDDECPRCDGSGKAREDKPRIKYEGVNPYTKRWGSIATYGGKLVENVTQATARDVLADGMIRAEAAGYAIVLTVHDELVTETPDTDEFTAEGLSAIMATNPPWADGLPLAAAGFEATRYGKE